jgi:hypothetical protein
LKGTLRAVMDRASRVFAFALMVTTAGASGCGDVTPEKIAHWKETERGPAKLREAVKSGSLAASLRAQAFAALVEVGMTQEALTELERAADAPAVIREAVPRLAELAGGGSKGADTTRVQREAKDALFMVRAEAPDEVKAKLDDALVAWTTADLAGRMQQGGHSSEKILTAIGQRALPRLLELVRADGPNQLTAADLIARINDPKAKAQAADLLVDAARRAATRTRDVPDGLLRAVAAVGGARATAFLVDQAEHGTEVVRERALLAVAQGAKGTSLAADTVTLAAALRIADDKGAPGKVREAAFQALEKIGEAAVSGLVRLEANPDLTVAERAIEAALAAGKEKAVAPVLEALPAKLQKREDVDSYVVHDLGLIGAPALPALKAALKAPGAVSRAAAIRAIALLGKSDDAQALAPLTGDRTPLHGFGGGATVGSEAKVAVATLKGKK